jgi:hypothetical protein
MDERQAVADFIERIVRDARLPGRGARDELREELQSHFAAAGSSPDALRDAMRRFGDAELLTGAFRYVHRWNYIVLYLLKIAASVIVSMTAALGIQVLVNLRLELQAEAWRLAPGFSKAAVISVGIVLGLVTAWEAARRPFDSRRALVAVVSRPRSLLLALAAFAGAIYGIHQAVSISVPPVRALVTGAVLLAVWASTVVILSQFDRAFGHLFSVAEKGSV